MSRQRLVLQPSQLEQIDFDSVREINLTINLTLEQQNYLYKVLRLKTGAEFIALNGRGKSWRVMLSAEIGQVKILEQICQNPPINLPTDSVTGSDLNPELPIDLTLAIAMPKGNGMEDVIRQATELGVSKIMPMWSERTVIRPHINIGAAKLERWLKIAQEISEQSHRVYVPDIHEPQTFIDVLTKFDDSQSHTQIGKYICVITKPLPHLLNSLLKLDRLPSKIVVLTGAEGGWTDSEMALAIAHNFQPVSLGDRVLAAVTAPIVALSIFTAVIESQKF
jgi:16S rRNA (uracil1498-N3)-methyltransferase